MEAQSIVVHHLDFSRSTRVLWFLEEIGLPYSVVRHERTSGFRAPAALRDVHPLGKAPVIVDGDLVIAETAAILAYLDETYARGRFTPSGTQARWRHAEWVAFAEGGAGSALMTCLYGTLVGGFEGVYRTMVARDAEVSISHIEAASGQPYLLGPDLTIADFRICYILELAKHLELLANHPAAAAYLNRLNDRPALRRAIEVGGPMTPGRCPGSNATMKLVRKPV